MHYKNEKLIFIQLYTKIYHILNIFSGQSTKLLAGLRQNSILSIVTSMPSRLI